MRCPLEEGWKDNAEGGRNFPEEEIEAFIFSDGQLKGEDCTSRGGGKRDILTLVSLPSLFCKPAFRFMEGVR